MKGLDHLVAGFREEAAERVAELEETLLELEHRRGDADLVDRAFRAMHTIKGSGAMFGFDDIASFTHELETVFDLVRGGRLAVSPGLVELALRGKDLIRAMLDGADDPAARAQLVEGLRALIPPAEALSGPTAERAPGGPGEQDVPARYRVRFAPNPDIISDGTNLLALLAELHALGPTEIALCADEVPPLEDLSPETCHVTWEAYVLTDQGEDAIRDVFIFVEGRCELRIEQVDRPDAPAPAASATEAAPVAAASVAVERSRPGAPGGVEPASSVRVAASKLDQLVDLVGELVIAQARLARVASRWEDPELRSVSEDIERLSTELRDGTLGIRMVPIGTMFSRFKRVTRDLAAELGKEIELVTEGADTELDKTVIEQLGDPLVHIIRNSCDHGIEAPEVRRAAGKPSRGTVRLSAQHAGSNVVIEIRDDGAGLDAAAIRVKAVERGLVASDANLPERELFQVVFLPGFSTAAKVSHLSGRGVGMDVVKRSVEALRGTVRIDGSPGDGTLVRIELPLTLAIIEGLLVAVGEGTYVLPSSTVEECVELTRDGVARGHGSRLAAVRGELVPYLRLREAFETGGERPEIEQIAIVRVEGTRIGLVVDHVLGQHQTVIKSLGRMYRNVKGLSGATILGDGTVALIVDVPEMVRELAA